LLAVPLAGSPGALFAQELPPPPQADMPMAPSAEPPPLPPPPALPYADPPPPPPSRRYVLPILRPSAGPLWLFNPNRLPGQPASTQSGLAVHVIAGAMIGWPGPGIERFFSPSLWLIPELGYDYRSIAGRGGHLGSLGLGLGYGNLLFLTGSYSARFVAGLIENQTAFGLRHGLALHFIGMLFSLEVSHQLLYAAGYTSHELQLIVGLNLGSMVLLGQ
jgi:hypothetical protein